MQLHADRWGDRPEPSVHGIEHKSGHRLRCVFVRRMDAALVERPVGAQVFVCRYAYAHIAGRRGPGKRRGSGREHHNGPLLDDRRLDRQYLSACRRREPADQVQHRNPKKSSCPHSESPSDYTRPARKHRATAHASPRKESRDRPTFREAAPLPTNRSSCSARTRPRVRKGVLQSGFCRSAGRLANRRTETALSARQNRPRALSTMP